MTDGTRAYKYRDSVMPDSVIPNSVMPDSVIPNSVMPDSFLLIPVKLDSSFLLYPIPLYLFPLTHYT